MYHNSDHSQAKPPINKQKALEAVQYLALHAQSHRKMWGHVLWMNLKGVKNIYASQTYFADIGDIGRPQASLNLNEMSGAAILDKKNRGIKKTCITSIPQELLHPTALLVLSEIFPWLFNYVRYALLINCSQPTYRTQVLLSKRKRAIDSLSVAAQAVFFDESYTGASPLPGALAHEPPIYQKYPESGDDYEDFANSIGAES